MNALEYLQSQKVNVELVLGKDNKDVLQINVRVRPWKQDTPTPRMVLACGLDVEDALNSAARMVYHQEWVKLDWTARTWLQGPQPVITPDHPENLSFLAPDAVASPRFPVLTGGKSGKGKNAPENASQ